METKKKNYAKPEMEVYKMKMEGVIMDIASQQEVGTGGGNE